MKKRNNFSQLSLLDRDRIEALIRSGHKQIEIAEILGVHKSTISREIRARRRQDGRYEAITAQHKAQVKRNLAKHQGRKVEQDQNLKTYVIAQLKNKQSPDAISGRMKKEGLPFYASKNAIYAWLYSAWGQPYTKYLCTKRYKPKKRREKAIKRVMIPQRTSFREIQVPITAEVDQAVSSRNTVAIAVAAKRQSKLVMTAKVPNHSPVSMRKAMKRLGRNTDLGQVIADNGIENKEHAQWGVPVCFADPHAPWQKPLVEQSIGLMRRWFFPKKKTDWNKVSSRELQTATHIINSKYRKSLNYQSAYEAERDNAKLKKITPSGVAFEG